MLGLYHKLFLFSHVGPLWAASMYLVPLAFACLDIIIEPLLYISVVYIAFLRAYICTYNSPQLTIADIHSFI